MSLYCPYNSTVKCCKIANHFSLDSYLLYIVIPCSLHQTSAFSPSVYGSFPSAVSTGINIQTGLGRAGCPTPSLFSSLLLSPMTLRSHFLWPSGTIKNEAENTGNGPIMVKFSQNLTHLCFQSKSQNLNLTQSGAPWLR